MRNWIRSMAMLAVLGGCLQVPAGGPGGPASERPAAARVPSAQEVARFHQVVAQVEPVAEAICRRRARADNCDFRIEIDMRPGQPANASQRLAPSGRPVIAFTAALVAKARNADELAFVLGHEAAHHIAGHIARTQRAAIGGAALGGLVAVLAGAGPGAVDAAQNIGATVGARRYSKAHELEADALGTEIAYRAGYDPARGALFFNRLPDPGDSFLGTHPPNAQRLKTVERTLRRLN